MVSPISAQKSIHYTRFSIIIPSSRMHCLLVYHTQSKYRFSSKEWNMVQCIFCARSFVSFFFFHSIASSNCLSQMLAWFSTCYSNCLYSLWPYCCLYFVYSLPTPRQSIIQIKIKTKRLIQMINMIIYLFGAGR